MRSRSAPRPDDDGDDEEAALEEAARGATLATRRLGCRGLRTTETGSVGCAAGFPPPEGAQCSVNILKLCLELFLFLQHVADALQIR